jgi:N-acetylglucosamine-6-phosphate deacetylase
MKILLTNTQVHTGTALLKNHCILIENHIIQGVFKEKPIDFEGKIVDLKGRHISSGFIDLHINGGVNYYMTQANSIAAIADIADASRPLGTTYTLPCLITSPLENILRGIEMMRQYMSQNPQSGVLGLHLEGPFLNPKRRGAHLLEYIQKPTDDILKTIIEKGRDVIKIMTIAPEQFTNNQLVMLQDSGIHISLGHSDATYEQATNAYDKGIKLCTHLYNAMSQMQHRAPGLVGATFDNSRVYAPIIIDGFHCDYAAARIAYKIKKDKLFLISDALFVDNKVQNFAWGAFNATLVDGQYRNSEGNLAGAAISMADAVRNAVKEVGISLTEAVKMATIRPAKAIDMADKIGRIEEGYPANLVAFDSDLKLFETLIF